MIINRQSAHSIQVKLGELEISDNQKIKWYSELVRQTKNFLQVTEWNDVTCYIVSVSYTHLDVYKRQDYNRLTMKKSHGCRNIETFPLL